MRGGEKREGYTTHDTTHNTRHTTHDTRHTTHNTLILHIRLASLTTHSSLHSNPSFAHPRIFEGNNALKDGDIKLNLAGVGVGNGLTAPEVQYAYYAEMAYNNSHGIQTVSESAYESMVDATPTCIDKIKKCNEKGGIYCTTSYTYCNTKLTTPYYQTGLNPYDIRKECGDNPLCYDFSNVEKWLTTDSTREALHVTSDSASWVSCNNDVNADFRNDWMLNYDSYVADMLEGGIKVLIYAGDVDFICNSLGNKAWTLSLDWSGKDSFNSAEDGDWNSGAGSYRSYGGLTFLTVFDAGHMVPSDQVRTSGKERKTREGERERERVENNIYATLTNISSLSLAAGRSPKPPSPCSTPSSTTASSCRPPS